MEHSIAAKYAARPAARFVRPSTRVRERRLGLRPSGSFHAPGRPLDGAARPGGRTRSPGCGPAGARSTRRSAGATAVAGRVRWWPWSGPAPGAPARSVARAPRRRRGAPEDRDRHLRRRDRRSLRSGTAVARRRQPPARARRADLDAAQGHAQPRREPRGDGDPRGRGGDRARGPDHRAARVDRVLVRPVRDAHPQDRPLLPDGADRRRPGPPRPRVRGGPLDRLRRGGRRC